MVFAGLLFVGGSLADRFGRKRFFFIGLTVFALGSISAAFSGSVDVLIACRAVMGAGAALTIPATLSIINDVFRDPVASAGPSVPGPGPSGSGSPSAPSPAACCCRGSGGARSSSSTSRSPSPRSSAPPLLVPDSKNPAADRPDPVGSLLSIAGLGLLLWAIIEAPVQGWTSASVVGVGLASLVVLGAFVAWEAHSPHPMLKLAFFSDRRFSVAAVGRVPRAFRADGRAVRLDPVPAVRARLLAPRRPGCASCPSPPCWW